MGTMLIMQTTLTPGSMASDKAPFPKQDTQSSPPTTKLPNSMPNDTKPAFHKEEFNKMQESLGQITIKQQT
jgi:hypothetical protein